jgi:hypothetical protein
MSVGRCGSDPEDSPGFDQERASDFQLARSDGDTIEQLGVMAGLQGGVSGAGRGLRQVQRASGLGHVLALIRSIFKIICIISIY